MILLAQPKKSSLNAPAARLHIALRLPAISTLKHRALRSHFHRLHAPIVLPPQFPPLQTRLNLPSMSGAEHKDFTGIVQGGIARKRWLDSPHSLNFNQCGSCKQARLKP